MIAQSSSNRQVLYTVEVRHGDATVPLVLLQQYIHRTGYGFRHGLSMSQVADHPALRLVFAVRSARQFSNVRQMDVSEQSPVPVFSPRTQAIIRVPTNTTFAGAVQKKRTHRAGSA